MVDGTLEQGTITHKGRAGFFRVWDMKAKSALRNVVLIFLLLLFKTKRKGCKPFRLVQVQL